MKISARYETEILFILASKNAAKMQSYGYDRERETTWRLIWTRDPIYIEHETIEERRVLAREALKSCGIIRLRYIRFAFAWRLWKLNGVNYIFSKAPISVSRGVAVTITENVGEITFARNV